MDFAGFLFCRGSIGPPYKIKKLWPRATKEPLQNQKQGQSALKSLYKTRDMCQKHTPRATGASTKSGTWAKGQLSLYKLQNGVLCLSWFSRETNVLSHHPLYKMVFGMYLVFLRAFLVPSSYSAQMCAHARFLIL